MTVFTVWAPTRGSVELCLPDSGASVKMTSVEGGWWETNLDAPNGTRYGFSLDGGPLRADPRSRWQPEGINGPSAVLNVDSFAWTDASWRGRPLASSLIYELHVGTFSAEGTFAGVIDKLAYLCELGVGAVELMPVAEASGTRGWGYDGVLLWAPHHAYGGPEGLNRLVDACHARGLAVILDVVYNHLGPAGNYLDEFGPYFTDRYQTPWGRAVNFDGPDSQTVRDFFIGNALMWMRDYHIDGLRLDAVHAIFDEGAVHVLEELGNSVRQLSHHLGCTKWLIAESDRNDPKFVRPVDLGGYGLDALWSDDFHHTIHACLTGESEGYYADFGEVGQLVKALQQVYVHTGEWSAYRQKRHGRPVGSLPGTHFLGYAQNHDQVGNRALGERLGMLVGDRLMFVVAALVILSPFVPMLFQGEEWGASTPFQYFTDHEDPELGRAVSEGRRREFAAFGWKPEEVPDPQDPATFKHSKLNWSELTDEPHAALLDWHRDLIQLRQKEPDLAGGDLQSLEVSYDEDENWLIMTRGSIQVVANLSDKDRSVPLAVAPRQQTSVLLESDTTALLDETIGLQPQSVAVLKLQL